MNTVQFVMLRKFWAKIDKNTIKQLQHFFYNLKGQYLQDILQTMQ